MQGLHVSHSVSPRESGVYSGREQVLDPQSYTGVPGPGPGSQRKQCCFQCAREIFKGIFYFAFGSIFFPAVLPSLISRMTIG